jgi:hypothetical protein
MGDAHRLAEVVFVGGNPQAASIPRIAVTAEALTAETRQGLKATPTVRLRISSGHNDPAEPVDCRQRAA